MREGLDNKIIVVELAGQSILLSNSSDNFKKELIAMGFVKKREVLCVRFTYKGYNSTDNFDKKTNCIRSPFF